MAGNGSQVVAVALHGQQPAVMGWPTPPEPLGKCGIGNIVTNGWPNYLVRSELCPYIWAINEQQHAMKISATTAFEAAKTLNIDFAAACAMSVVELHKAYTKAYNACNEDTMKFWSNMIALRASQQL